MSGRHAPKPRTIADIVREMRERAEAARKPVPPPNAPPPPPSHFDPKERE